MPTCSTCDTCDECRAPATEDALVALDVLGVVRVCVACALVIGDEQIFEAHADDDLVGACDCESCQRHRCRVAQREDKLVLAGRHYASAEQAIEACEQARALDVDDIDF